MAIIPLKSFTIYDSGKYQTMISCMKDFSTQHYEIISHKSVFYLKLIVLLDPDLIFDVFMHP